MPRIDRAQTSRARALRRAETPAERELWRWLRNRKLQGAKFRRQQPLGPCIVDFFCAEAALIIEADGAGHFPPPPYDRWRDGWLTAAGMTILRLENREILETTQLVLDRIREALRRTRTTDLHAIIDETQPSS